MITVRETINTKFGATSFRIPFTMTSDNTKESPPLYYDQYIGSDRGVEYFRADISFQAKIRYSNRNTSNEAFSTSALFAAFTKSDIDRNSKALKNSFFVFEFMLPDGLNRFGYLFFNLTKKNIVLSKDGVTNVGGKAFIDRRFDPKVGVEYPVSISFFNGKLGNRSRFFLGGEMPSPFIKFTDRKNIMMSTQDPLVIFESFSPTREALEDNGGITEYRSESLGSPKIQGQGGQLFTMGQVTCGGDILFTENC